MSGLIPRTLLQQGSVVVRAAAVGALRELPAAWSMSNQCAQPSTLSQGTRNWQPAYVAATQARGFHVTAGWSAGVEVKVPALGESITDGTIAVLLKQPGEAVAEDEPIMQIETDKVTIDVRAPSAGVLEAFLVKENDNVVVGQPIATIGSGEGAAAAPQPAAEQAAAAPPAAAAAPPPPQPPAPPRQQQPPPPCFAASAGGAEAPKRKPSISFPPRRTDAGERISDMPRAEAQAYLEAAAKAAKPKPTIAPPFSRTGPPLPRPPRQLVRPPPALKGQISEKEMEAIMLGGADF